MKVRVLGLSLGLLAATYVAACLLPGEPSAGERIGFRFDLEQPYRVPLAGSRVPAIAVLADGRVLQNAKYRLESLDTTVVRVDVTGRRVQGVTRGPAAVRVVYETAMGTSDTVFSVQVVIMHVNVSVPSLAFVRLGADRKLTAFAMDANFDVVPNVPFNWSSSDSTVAVVNDTGLVTAVDEGTATITVEADSVAAATVVTVTQEAARVVVAPELDSVRTVGREVPFVAVAFDPSGDPITTARPRWTSSDTAVARVDSDGLATTTGGGVTRIVARVGAAADSATLVVAQVVRFLIVTPGLDTLTAIGDATRIIPVGSDSLNSPILTPTIIWTTGDSAIARVDATGLVTAVANGAVLITASSGGQSAFATIVVRQAVAAARVSPDSVALTGAGDTVRLDAIAVDRNGYEVHGTAFTWRSNNEFVAVVDSAGLLSARGDGLTGIVAATTTGGRSDTARVSVTGAPQLGALLIRTTTTGPGNDPDGYVAVVDDDSTHTIGPNHSIALTTTAGVHVVKLIGNAANCFVGGSNPRAVNVPARDTARVDFAIDCGPSFDSLVVTTNTTGLDLDPDGYEVQVCYFYYGYCYYPWTQRAPSNGTVVFAPLSPSIYTVALADVAANCSVASENPDTVITSLGVTHVGFNVTCVQGGNIHVTTTTSGADLDLNGYTVRVGGEQKQIGVNDATTFTNLLPGDYVVSLDGNESNCTLSGPRVDTVTVTAGATVNVAFALTCSPLAAIRATLTTTGSDLALNGYFVDVKGPGTDYSLQLTVNGTVLVPRLPGGTYTLRLFGWYAMNCSSSGPAADTVTVAPGDTATVSFGIVCTTAEQLMVAMFAGGNTDIYLGKSSGTGFSPLTSHAARDAEPAWSASSGRIAFVSERDGNPEIYVMNADGSGQLRLTNSLFEDRDPAWSPDGLQLAFWSTRDGNREIYVMNADGSGLVRLTNNSARDVEPAWSPDGLKIAFISDRSGETEIHSMNADGSGVTRLTVTGPYVQNSHPDWSPDGTKLAYSRLYCPYYCEIQLAVINADGSGGVVLPSYNALDPAWSPDGAWIAYSQGYCDYAAQCYRGEGVWAARADGTRDAVVMTGAFQPAWRR